MFHACRPTVHAEIVDSSNNIVAYVQKEQGISKVVIKIQHIPLDYGQWTQFIREVENAFGSM